MKGNIFLGTLAIGFALLAYMDRQSPPAFIPSANGVESSVPLFAIPVAEIAAVKVMERQTCFVVRRETLSSPNAEALIESLRRAQVVRRFFPPSADLSPYGLTRPDRQVVVERISGEQRQVMDLGSLNPLGNAIYVRLQDEPEVLLVGSYFLTSLDMALQRLQAEGNRFVERNCSIKQVEERE